MRLLTPRLPVVAATAALTVALAPTAAWAHGAAAPTTADGTSVPLVMSPNVSLLSSVPVPGAISLEWARTGDFAYVSSATQLVVLDTSDPAHPVRRGTMPVALFENESMTYGERRVDGTLRRFVFLGIDLYEADPAAPDHVNVGGREAVVVDVTDPDAPHELSRVETTTSTHTVQCVSQANCRYAYTAGTRGAFSVIDLTDLEHPVELRTVKSSAAGPGGPTSPFADGGAGHYWDFDGVLGWHTGSGGAQAFDVSDPRSPRPVNGTGPQGRATPYNDFILHNSMRPNAKAFRPHAPASVANGNVLIVTEEDYANDGDEVLCDKAGTIQTWYVPDLDARSYRTRNPDGSVPDVGTLRPLDITNVPDEFGGGLTTPLAGFCSAHWFDVHQDGFVAQGYYGEGLRLLDVRDPRNITQIGYVTSTATEVWDAYWVPQRTKKGVVKPGLKTDVVYTADAARGIDVYSVALPAKGVKAQAAIAPGPSSLPSGPTGEALGLLALSGAALGGGVVLVRRQRRALAV